MERIGHRGAKGYVAENTIASINYALELGVEAIEIDVHVCKTGELLVIHDKTVNRTTSGKGKVRKLSFNDIKKLTADGFPIPTLKEVLAHCAGKCKIHIELKGSGTALKVVNLIEDSVGQGTWSYEQLLVSSFKLSRLKKIRKTNTSIPLGVIMNKKTSKALRLAVKNSYESVYVFHKKLRPRFVRIAKLKNINIYAWTVNEANDIKKVNKLNIDGIISDFPDRL